MLAPRPTDGHPSVRGVLHRVHLLRPLSTHYHHRPYTLARAHARRRPIHGRTHHTTTHPPQYDRPPARSPAPPFRLPRMCPRRYVSSQERQSNVTLASLLQQPMIRVTVYADIVRKLLGCMPANHGMRRNIEAASEQWDNLHERKPPLVPPSPPLAPPRSLSLPAPPTDPDSLSAAPLQRLAAPTNPSLRGSCNRRLRASFSAPPLFTRRCGSGAGSQAWRWQSGCR